MQNSNEYGMYTWPTFCCSCVLINYELTEYSFGDEMFKVIDYAEMNREMYHYAIFVAMISLTIHSLNIHL